MNVAIFGATGMVGQGVLRECLRDSAVTSVLVVGRTPTGQQHLKLREHVLPDITNLATLGSEIRRLDACLFCVGVSSLGMSEIDYTRVTYDLTLAVANALLARRPALVFEYISGKSTDTSERGRMMWARVKGKTENALLRMPFGGPYMFRPGLIVPGPGIQSRTAWYRLAYAVTAPIGPTLRRLFPSAVTTSEQLGRAMLAVARDGYPKSILESRDINAVAG
jgi:uncharacterized protein YbjT (DUF2867 family)